VKKLCQTERNIVERVRKNLDDPIVPNKVLFGLHCVVYHRPTSEFGRPMEFCKVWNAIVDDVTWEEMVEIAVGHSEV